MRDQQLGMLARPKKRLAELVIKTELDTPDQKTQERWSEADKEFSLKLFFSPLRGSDGLPVARLWFGSGV